MPRKIRAPKFNEDGTESVQPSGLSFTAAFINAMHAAAAEDELPTSVWVKQRLMPLMKESGHWPPPKP
jgi:hypothetical protein